jgi:hypothetical protein
MEASDEGANKSFHVEFKQDVSTVIFKRVVTLRTGGEARITGPYETHTTF